MEIETAQSPKTKMESLRSICDREVRVHQQNLDSFTALFPTSLHFIKALAQDAAQAHVELAKLKANLREAEDELVKVLAAKTRKEAKQMATRDSISAIKARVEEFKRTVQVQKARRDELESIISQESLALAKFEKVRHEIKENGEIHEAISWYNRVLGFQIEGGHVLDCDPPLNGIGELINELNRTNGLFKFVRITREKFQEAATLGLQPQSTSFRQGSSAISMSCPALSVSTDISESSTKKNEHRVPLQEVNRQVEEVNYRSKSPSKATENKLYDGRFNRYSKKPN
ncbi:hypothetical protein ERO13_D09G168200v2 [Gossypium hirsutum]|nr:hypothetical protein ERO13_D09G168200v2 [Gossypium hirsutum]KAG4130809.1 hypothetical protein ERO13_D09G168200v2 [Gossypium hirsutum]KAG4130810.1 hypothetical protein ERO13_D09G168200v2 [Gossypium hirsutum]KAG4130811.1 hypothetical protein ERO13_D09G168200v2 [Gossypium hirsutum]